jgi:hypothetical protein
MAHTKPPSGRARLYVMHGSVIPVVKAFGSNPRSFKTLDDIPFDGAFGFCFCYFAVFSLMTHL